MLYFKCREVCKRVEMETTSAQQKMTSAEPKLQVSLNLKAPKPTKSSCKHESNVTFYLERNYGIDA